MSHLNRFCFLLSFLILTNKGLTQNKTGDSLLLKIIVAGPEYKKPKSYQKLWGRNWRIEWATAVHVPVLWLDKIDGGLIPSKTNGGNETKGLKLKSANGREYALRSINKSRSDVTPKDFRHTFVADLIQDGVSMSHPYGAFALSLMEQSAGIYHTEPRLVYLPHQPALDTLDKEFGDDVYMLEQRLSGDWSDADNLGNFKNFLSTEEVVSKLKEENNNKADQQAFASVRLFDMMIADWDRHEDQWKWGERKMGEGLIYIAVPKDRDQAFFVHNGFLIDKALSAIGNGYMQSFDYDSKNISAFNFEERKIDRFFTNEMSLNDWIYAAKKLQQSLSDEVIERSIQQLPPEIFSVSGKDIIKKLKSRRENLVEYATQYYFFLAKEVEVAGSKKREYFEIKTTDAGELSIKIFDIPNDGKRNDTAFYSRIFKPNETKTIRLYGVDGEDIYSIDGKGTGIKLCIIGGADKDSVIQNGNDIIHIYDDRQNFFQTTHARYHLSSDSDVHVFSYAGKKVDRNEFTGLTYTVKGIKPSFLYNNEDRFFIGLGYGFKKYKWRRDPFATTQLFDLHYSISQKAFSVKYTALFPNVIHKWNLFLSGNYDAVRWTNFFGLGNETTLPVFHKNYFRMRTKEWFANAGINRQFGKSTVSISGFFQTAKIIADTERYIAKVFLLVNKDVFEHNNYAGAQIGYTFLKLNDSIVPTKGITFMANASFFNNIIQKEFFQKYYVRLQFYIPLGDKFSLLIKAGGSTIICKNDIPNGPEFYEHAVIGGPSGLRGYRRERFWGKSSFYNNNELRFITKIRTHLLNAKADLLVFFDDGRIWMPGESSNTLHTSYGPGIIFAPFNKISAIITYGISKESRLFQLSINKLF